MAGPPARGASLGFDNDLCAHADMHHQPLKLRAASASEMWIVAILRRIRLRDH